MKKRIAAAALAVAAVAGGIALKPREGCGAKCCHRPAPEADCKRRNPVSGVVEDYGDGTMPGTHAIGADCAPAECVVGLGVEAP